MYCPGLHTTLGCILRRFRYLVYETYCTPAWQLQPSTCCTCIAHHHAGQAELLQTYPRLYPNGVRADWSVFLLVMNSLALLLAPRRDEPSTYSMGLKRKTRLRNPRDVLQGIKWVRGCTQCQRHCTCWPLPFSCRKAHCVTYCMQLS